VVAFTERGGVFTVRYDSADDLSPERQRALEAALRAASLERRLGIVFVIGPTVRWIDPSVPAYWLGVTGDRLIRLVAMAIVTGNPGVSVATRGFSVANTLRDRPIQVRPFPDEAAAQAWVAEVMSAGAAPRA
jgi:hypothetical protein